MDAQEIARTANRLHAAVATRSMAAANAQERRFWLGLACAAALHAALIFELSGSSPRQTGERDGRPDALSVELVDVADLPGKPTPPRQDIPPTPPREAVQPAPPSAGAPEQPKTTARPLDKDTAVPLPGPAAKQSGTGADKKSNAKPQQQSDLQLQLDLPDRQMIPGARGAAVARPPDITRSGENDEFGRSVIRALRQTMPSPTPRDWLGRVTIRLLLSETGNLAEVRLIRSGGDPYMDQSVVFAAKQSSFPIPPAASTSSDRTFMVTYIYH